MINLTMKKTLYGCDVFYKSDRNIKISNINFKGVDDVKTISVEDLFYKYFKIDNGDFFFYDDVVYADFPFPVISVFSPSVSELPFVAAAVSADVAELGDEEEKEILSHEWNFRSCEQEEFDFESMHFVSGSYSCEAESFFSPAVCHIKVSRKGEAYVVMLNMAGTEFFRKYLADFFSVSEDNVIVESNSDLQMDKAYLVSVLRASIIAVEAARKFDCNIVFQFRPFTCCGEIRVDRRTFFREQDESRTTFAETISISLNFGKSSVFKDEILKNIMTACIPPYPVEHIRYEIVISGGGGRVYNTDIGSMYYDKVLSLTMLHIARLSKKGFDFATMPFSNDEKLMNTFIRRTVDDEFRKSLSELIGASGYFEKKEIDSRNSERNLPVFSARRLNRRVVAVGCISKEGVSAGYSLNHIDKLYAKSKDLLPFFGFSQPSFFVAEYNPAYMKLSHIYALLCCDEKKPVDEEKLRLKGILIRECCRQGVEFVSGFDEGHIVLKVCRQRDGFDADGAIRSFAMFLKEEIVYESKMQNRRKDGHR